MKYENVGDKNLLIKNAETALDDVLSRRATMEIIVNK